MSNNLKIHLTGICGIAMGTLAQMLHDRGFTVTGSDTGIYPPMSDILAARKIKLFDGYRAENVSGADLVIIGNAVSRGNPEAEQVLDAGIPYMSMPRAIEEFFLKGRDVVCVAGTHGKSTTTALLAHILNEAGMRPSMFVGAVTANYGSSYMLGEGRHFIIEGDEYDSAFFEKFPKFITYQPDNLIITSLEFDHADIFADLAEIEMWFRRLVNIIPAKGTVVYSNEYKNIPGIAEKAFSRKISFGAPGADYVVRRLPGGDGDQLLDIARNAGGDLHVRASIHGCHNCLNIAAAAAMASALGADEKSILSGIASFKGIKRRLEIIYESERACVYEDFAHHPTAVKHVLNTLKDKYPASRLIAVFEPRSATSRRNVFQKELPAAFAAADLVLLKNPFNQDKIKAEERLDINMLNNDLNAVVPSRLFKDVNGIVETVLSEIKNSEHTCVLIMSNGGFDGIYGKLTDRIKNLSA